MANMSGMVQHFLKHQNKTDLLNSWAVFQPKGHLRETIVGSGLTLVVPASAWLFWSSLQTVNERDNSVPSVFSIVSWEDDL